MSYNIARRISRKRNTKEDPKRPARDSYFVVDTIRPTGGPTSIVSYPVEPGGTLVDENAVTTAAKLDKAWFESHPNRSHRIRHPVNGEMPGMTTEGYVVVRQINPGFRSRQAFTTPVPLPEDEAPEHIAHAIYDLVDEHRAALSLRTK
jgi:hypothetical protein